MCFKEMMHERSKIWKLRQGNLLIQSLHNISSNTNYLFSNFLRCVSTRRKIESSFLDTILVTA